MIESLESRRLLSFTLGGGTLTVNGKPGVFNDIIKVSQQDAATIRLEDNGVVNLFADSAVSKIVINGGDGNDRLTVVGTVALPLTEPATVNGGNGNDILTGGDGGDKLDGGAGNDSESGNNGADNLIGGEGNNTLSGGAGNDTMTGGTGADSMDGGADIDTATYSTRTASLTITLDNVANDGQLFIIPTLPPTFKIEGDNVKNTVENVIGGNGNDTITASSTVSVNNTFTGNGGNDRLDGYGSNDSLVGGSGNDILIGRAGNDICLGGDGNDSVVAGSGDDSVRGGAGDDVLNGGTGKDSLFGEDGNDFLLGQDSTADGNMDGGSGFDIAELDAVDVLRVSLELVV
jgi:Ca2+-binding RTX toxin-like protein